MSFLTAYDTIKLRTSLTFALSGSLVATVVAATVASANTLTIPDTAGADTFLFVSASQNLTNKTLGGDLNANSHKITNLATPTASGDAVNKGYADGLSTGLDIHAACHLKTAAALPANTYVGTPTFTLTATGNAALSVDSIAVVVGQRILVNNEATNTHNGLYVVTATGSGAAPYVLTRAVDFNSSALISTATYVFIEAGSTNAGTGWVEPSGSLTLDTSAIAFTQFTASTAFTAGNGISISSGVVSAVGDGTSITVGGGGIGILSTWAGQAAITTVGTIGTGTWAGTAIGTTHGGTGAVTAAAGFNALSPMTSVGDIIYGGTSGAGTRLAPNTTTAKEFLSSTGTGSVGQAPAWGVLAGTDIPAINLAAGGAGGVTGTLPIANGGSGQATPAAALAAFGGTPIQCPILTKSANYSMVSTDCIVQFTTSSSALVCTPPAAGSGTKGILYAVAKADGGTGSVAITPATGTINGAASFPVDTQNNLAWIFNDSVNYFTA